MGRAATQHAVCGSPGSERHSRERDRRTPISAGKDPRSVQQRSTRHPSPSTSIVHESPTDATGARRRRLRQRRRSSRVGLPRPRVGSSHAPPQALIDKIVIACPSEYRVNHESSDFPVPPPVPCKLSIARIAQRTSPATCSLEGCLISGGNGASPGVVEPDIGVFVRRATSAFGRKRP